MLFTTSAPMNRGFSICNAVQVQVTQQSKHLIRIKRIANAPKIDTHHRCAPDKCLFIINDLLFWICNPEADFKGFLIPSLVNDQFVVYPQKLRECWKRRYHKINLTPTSGSITFGLLSVRPKAGD
ncbi:MAG TPA: hypothetical protein DCS93_36240 [Microscillaceae bacterium]|nr:hypothetical protein [Microscillaceae bacterium]